MTTTHAGVDATVAAAAGVAQALADAPDLERAGWLRAVADSLDAAGGALVALADDETHLGPARLAGELARTTAQLRFVAGIVAAGDHLEVVIDHADASAVPPAPDLRRMLVPVGPVVVFAASNFPFAFSVAGGDTAAALAVGCPVIVKAHEGHPRLSHRTAELVAAALRGVGAPHGAFALVEGREAGTALVVHPEVEAVGFTGSVAGGRALHELAAGRPRPIPFFGELGSLNPVVLTRAAVAARAEELATGLAGSFTLGAGQFCTKPGLVLLPAGDDAFRSALVAAVTAGGGPAQLLTPAIAEGFSAGLARLAGTAGVEVVAGVVDQAPGAASPVVLAAPASAVRAHPEVLAEECFGPVTVLAHYTDEADLLATLRDLPGSLTATLHAEPADDLDEVVALLRARAGRLVLDGWPTGVAVRWAQHHGGPYPAATSSHTSVGGTALRRFQRPVAYQGWPDARLPAPLLEANPLRVLRRVDGVLGR